jgi:co-chaperonin GroES (HSP10)
VQAQRLQEKEQEIMELKVIGDKVLVEPFTVDDTSRMGLTIPEPAQSGWAEATVAAVGLGGAVQDSPICVGDDILFRRTKAKPVTIREEKYFMVELEDICTVIQ